MEKPNRQCVAIIGARKGSKRLPGKNLLPLNGKPLYRHTLESAIASDLFDRIVFTTDDEGILADLQSEKNILADKRPAGLSGDDATTMDVISDLLIRYPDEIRGCECMCLLTPCNPFRKASHIRAAFRLYWQHQPSSLLSVTEYPFPLELALEMDQQRVYRQWSGAARPADYRVRYYPNGAVIILNRQYFQIHQTYYAPDTIGYIMGWPECIDIDYIDDYRLAKMIMENGYQHKTI